MDQGVICSLKACYKALALQRLVVAIAIDKGKDLPVFSILDAMKMLNLAWLAKSENLHYPALIVNLQKSAQSQMTTTPSSEIFKTRSKNLVNFTLKVQ